jgi:hypothetical protein
LEVTRFDKTIKLWDKATGEELMTFQGNAGPVMSLCVSPDGRRIASGSTDNTIKLWDTTTGEELTTLRGHTGSVMSVHFSPDGRRIASGSEDNVIRIWDASPGTELVKVEGYKLGVVGGDVGIDRMRAFAGKTNDSEIFPDDKASEGLPFDDDFGFQAPFDDTNTGSTLSRWLKVRCRDRMYVVDLAFRNTPEERLRRELLAGRKPSWHWQRMLEAKSSGEHFQVLFHAAWLLKINPSDAWRHDDLQKAHQDYLALHAGKTPPLPAVAVEMLQIPRGSEFPQLNEESAIGVNQQIWELVKAPTAENSAALKKLHLQKLRDTCQKLPKGVYLHTLGIAEYRLGEIEAAMRSLSVSTEKLPAELGLSGPHPVDLGFLAMCHHQLGHKEEASRFLDQMRGALKDVRYVFDASTQQLTQEAIRLLNGADAFPELSSPVQIAQEATFENLVSHHWKIATWRNRPEQVSLSNDVIHEGMTALQIQVTQEADDVTLYQAVALEPNQKYRLTGWIRTDNVTVDPMETGTTGACLTIFGQTEISESVLGTSDWKQVAVEFTSGESSTLNIGCRLGHNGSTCTGTAWFDDLKLEKVE